MSGVQEAEAPVFDPSELEKLLIPGTPEPVAELYRSLPERARTTSFGLLEEDLVILDTETTGLSFRRDDLIEIAAVRISGKRVADRFQTFVKPGLAIPEEITQLTGITNLDVAKAPSQRAAVAELARFAGGLPILAHNAVFDRSFVQKVPGGELTSNVWIDSLMLSRIALPRLSSHALSAMAKAFGISPVTHRAMADVEALTGMWPVLLAALQGLPQGFLARLADTHPEVEWPYRPIFSSLSAGDPKTSFSLLEVRKDLVRQEKLPQKRDARELAELVAPSTEEIDEAFSRAGVIGTMYDAFEPRPEQTRMAKEVADALASSTHRAIEAATGTGKSVAYLLPLALFAKENGITCGVASKTNALTDQLVASELPALAKALPGGVTFASLKGYDHYPCLRRVERALEWDLPIERTMQATGATPEAAATDLLNAIAVTLASACQSPQGDLDSLGIRWKFVPRGLLTTTPEECLHARCPFYPHACLLHGARQRAQSVDIVVTNHSLLLRDVEAEGKILPPIRHWVVDEAQGFEDEARSQWAVEAQAAGVSRALEMLGGLQTGAIHNLLVQVAGVEAGTTPAALLTRAAGEAARIAPLSADFFDHLVEVVRVAAHRGGYDLQDVRVSEELRARPEFEELAECAGSLIPALSTLVLHLGEAQALVNDAVDAPAGDLDRPKRELVQVLRALRNVFERPDETTFAYLSASLQASRRGTEKLVVEKYDIGAELAERWYPEMMGVIYCSATLALEGNFERFCHSVGLDLVDTDSYATLALESSYDFDHAMQVVVAQGLPEPNNPNYQRLLTDFLYDVHVAMGGSVLTLFTNRRDMEKVYRTLMPRLREVGLPLLQQERGTNVRRLRERFVKEEELSLLALRSFWEGVDAAGDTLRCVVVPKMPFAVPTDPLTQERDARDERAWSHYSLPDAVLLVKQAAGRLIRSSTDVGVLVLADSRLLTRSYGPSVVRAMPSESVSVVSAKSIERFIESWRRGRGR